MREMFLKYFSPHAQNINGNINIYDGILLPIDRQILIHRDKLFSNILLYSRQNISFSFRA